MSNKIAILCGSKSDIPVVEKGLAVLRDFGAEYDLTVTSAHRSLGNTAKVVAAYQSSGVQVFIACAGASAHLAGVVAALTTLPVIGVPVGSSSIAYEVPLFSMVQMPAGIPVATVGVNAVENAAVLAVQILALQDKTLAAKLKKHKAGLENKIKEDNKLVRKQLKLK